MAVPVCVAAFLRRIPLIIHEQTVSVGLANRICGCFARKILLSYAKSARYFNQAKTLLTGAPLRSSIADGSRESFRRRFKITNTLPSLYITGGGQGSRIINDTIFAILPVLRENYNVIHQFGKGDINTGIEAFQNRQNESGNGIYHVASFYWTEIADILMGADLLIGRSGAGTVADARYAGLPSLFIPLKIATKNEQFLNAGIMRDEGSARILAEDDVTPEKLLAEIETCLSGLDQMRTNAKSAMGQDGTAKIIEQILDA